MQAIKEEKNYLVGLMKESQRIFLKLNCSGFFKKIFILFWKFETERKVTNTAQRFPYRPKSLAVIGIVSVLNISHSNRCIMIPCCFNLHCPNYKSWSSFHMLICLCISSLVRCLFEFLAHFLLRDLFFLFRVLSIFGIQVLYHIFILQIFSPSM